MASAGPDHANLGPKQQKSIGLESATLPAERPQPCWAWHLAQQQAKPIWNLEKRYVNAFQDRILLPSGIPLQQSCFSCSPSLCHAQPTEDSLQSPPDTGSVTRRAMSSMLMEPCLLAEERSKTGVKGSAFRSGQQAASSCRPVLNNNSFLRPSGAKVPFLQSLKMKKVENIRSFPAASWSHSGDNRHSFRSSLINGAVMNSNVVSEQNTIPSLSPLPSSAVLRKDQCSLEDAKGRLHSSKEKEPEKSLLKAVQYLSSQAVTCRGFGCQVESSGLMNVGSQSNQNGRRRQHVGVQSTRKESIAPLKLELGSHRLNSNSSLMGTCEAAACTKQISVHPLALHADAPDCSTGCRPMGVLSPLCAGDRLAGTEPLYFAAISEVAAQVSTIQLEKEEEQGQAVVPGKLNATAEKSLLEPSHPQDEAEEELPDGLDESCSQEEYEDSDSDTSSDADVSSSDSVTPVSRNCIECLAQPAEAQDKVLKPALVCSLFPNVPPTIYFSTRDETVEKLPWEQRKLLRWKICRVTPNIVKQTIGRSHFRVSKKSNDWLGCWGHHMKSPGFKAIREHQKLNHFPGSFQIGRKDRLWRNLLKMQARCGKKEFNFFPQSFILPQDIKLLRKAWEEGASRQKWIVKPPASARGIGIQVIHKWSQLPKRRPLLVQRYLHKPYLIGGKKFDLRIYVYVTCYDPLRVYLFKDGLVRFASCKYSSSMESLSNKFMHLTNYSVNKKNTEYKPNSDETACQGHKWALKALWSYLTQKGVNSEAIWEKIKDIVIKTIIASEPYVNSLVKMYVRRPYCCHELFGFDIMLDENLKPWILEVNISPSLHSNSPLDVSIKGQMIRDLLNLAGFVLPSSVASRTQTASGSTFSLGSALKEKPKPAAEHLKAEKMKKAYYLMQKIPDQDFYSSVLDVLTPDDVRILVETEDEYSRRGQFERVFPSHISMRYLRFFEQPRYFNILVTQWELKYYLNRHKGLELLKNWCVKGYHTGAGTDLAQMWSLPKSFFLQKSSIQSNSFSKLELGSLGTCFPSAGENLTSCLEPSPTQSLPLSKCTGGANQRPPGCLSDTALAM
ncbi:tubulin polyglutamylase TTLL4 isoform X1 [Parus major]|uniref:tubulin polyglutamylase TTLL4 isoform X1 n=1 Tax=Parus major TaxID=9157 RepID=UPI000771009B|nr:tubulin polyglutamylase TTLL4 isoform X1 [Parus major]XP_015490255.1 tubulin polyglutamylase TTLL4 isoform X1 [Parus major]XP_015490256.1 tubulin polyglutamylase TTLL4 isoform X1 [Parus major]XP_015490258.1 tubulin polyglutamylase TTLL4 isoform X1 [Parus major]XP_033372104.1 tubulin polyglutamylase TTLL4 isoform X1 [Parus major]XP_033372105.1 tubulin polyglutamylase TTLL4 isoform X1 [Parus major]XP_033372106.1 tubulin polyglutamylase TTLL4 isoform X1 [Parus major]